MPPLAPEIGLLYALALNAVVLVGAWRLACRFSGDGAQRAVDMLLLFLACSTRRSRCQGRLDV
jgi:hypothetical protein